MADPLDVRASKYLRSEFGKKLIDVTQADVRVLHGVAYIRGVVKPIVGGPSDLKSALNTACTGLRQKGTIKDYVLDCVYRT
jgi:hypothetical protein